MEAHHQAAGTSKVSLEELLYRVMPNGTPAKESAHSPFLNNRSYRWITHVVNQVAELFCVEVGQEEAPSSIYPDR